MNESSWRNLSIVLGLVCALLLGVTASLLLNPGGSRSAATPTAVALRTPTPTTATPSAVVATPKPTASPSPSPSAAPTATPSPTATPRPTPSAPMAGVTFTGLQLDAEKDADAQARTFTFTSDGFGAVTAKVIATTGGSTKLCASVDGSTAACWAEPKPGMPLGYADTDHSVWTVTLLGVDVATPVVSVSFGWPSTHPSVRLTHGRMQGKPQGDALRGFTARFKTRAPGNMGVEAAWPPLVLNATLTVNDVTGATPVLVNQAHYTGKGSVSPVYSHALQANKTYEVSLENDSADSGRPDLTATVTFP